MTDIGMAVIADALPEDVKFLTALVRSTAKELVSVQARVTELEQQIEKSQQDAMIKQQIISVLHDVIEALQETERG